MATLSDVIERYQADRRARGIKHATLRGEKTVLLLLLADVGNIQSRNLRPQHLDTFWANRTTWGPGSMNRARHILNSFFNWCRTRGHLVRDANPMEGTRKLRVPPRDWVTIPQAEFEEIIEKIEDPRRRVIAALGFYLFVRKSDMRSLRWQDYNEQTATIEVYRPKTSSLDTLPVCDELARELQRWRLAYAARVGDQVVPSWYLIPGMPSYGGQTGERGKKGFVRAVPRPYLPTVQASIGFDMKEILVASGHYRMQEGGHTLRRSGAIALYNQLSSVGHDRAIRIVQAMLGHSSVQTTEIYLRLDLDRKVRNDLLAGKRMFPESGAGSVIHLGGAFGRESAASV